MSFAESFVECMSNAGVHVDASSVTDESHFTESVSYVQSWFNGLDQTTRDALDAATTNDNVAHLLAEANVAPGIPELLAHFDAALGWPLSTLLSWCQHCIGEASQANQAQASSSA